MTPKQAKLAYALLCSCFILWLALILSACFISGRWALPIVFPNQFMLALFVASAVLSSIPAMLMGLAYLGINVTQRGRQNSKNPLLSVRTRDSDPTTETPLSQESAEKLMDETTYESTSKHSPWAEQNTESAETASVNLKDKNKDRMRAFFLFGETEFDHCAHKLGYLKGLPKNKPIPDECFGCPEILECIALTRKTTG